MSAAPALTAVVLTLDEAEHLPDCLASLAWADRLLVLDSGSRDGTVAIARAAGARVETRAFENYARQRNQALALVDTPWLLFVDADERVPEALAREIRTALARPEPAPPGYWIPRRNDFWGHRLRGGGWWPDRQLRLLRVDRARYDPEQAVHEVAQVDGPTENLSEALLHLNYASPAEFRAKQAAYARLDVQRRRAAGWRVRPRQLLLQPWRAFWRRYVNLEGWRDGGLGLWLCAWMAWYELATLWALWRGPVEDPIGLSPGPSRG